QSPSRQRPQNWPADPLGHAHPIRTYLIHAPHSSDSGNRFRVGQQYSGSQRTLDVMNDRIPKLTEQARARPNSPGVYLMKDDKGHVIYVGKSASLRDRVSSYFLASTKLEHKKAGLLDHVVDFDIIQTDSEVEALLTENRLIKDIQPRYNA